MEKYVMLYDIQKNNDKTRILGNEFVKNNKNKGKIIHKNKKYSLEGLFKNKDLLEDSLKIKMILSKNIYNKSFMFKDCISLLKIKFDNYIYNKENNLIDDISALHTSQSENIEIEKSMNIIKGNSNHNLEWNTNICAVNEMFLNCLLLTSLPDISKWDTSKVIEMRKIFYNCRKLPVIPDIFKWNTINVIDMNKIFYNCISQSSSANKVKLNINNVYKMNNMSSMLEKSSVIFKLIYEIKGETTIKIFDSKFISKNKSKCKMVINNKIYAITNKCQIVDSNMKILKIKLIVLKKKCRF